MMKRFKLPDCLYGSGYILWMGGIAGVAMVLTFVLISYPPDLLSTT